MSEWTHKKLVRRMADWLKWSKKMTVVISELSTRNSETPDVIGWIGGAHSILIECKMSRSDFLADGNKWFRRTPELGMGNERYIAAPKGLISVNELPCGWGLLEVDGRYVLITKKSESHESQKSYECVMLMSVIRRLEISTAVYVVQETEEV